MVFTWRMAENRKTKTKRDKTPVENDAFAKFVLTIVRRLGVRVAGADTAQLPYLQAIASEAEAALAAAVRSLRANGYTWAEVGRDLNISRQAAQQRFGGAK